MSSRSSGEGGLGLELLLQFAEDELLSLSLCTVCNTKHGTVLPDLKILVAMILCVGGRS